MKFSKQLLYRTHAGDCFFDFLMKMPLFSAKDIALYCFIEPTTYFIKITISYKKQDFVLRTLSLYIFLTLTVSVIGVIQKVSLPKTSNF